MRTGGEAFPGISGRIFFRLSAAKYTLNPDGFDPMNFCFLSVSRIWGLNANQPSELGDRVDAFPSHSV